MNLPPVNISNFQVDLKCFSINGHHQLEMISFGSKCTSGFLKSTSHAQVNQGFPTWLMRIPRVYGTSTWGPLRNAELHIHIHIHNVGINKKCIRHVTC